jgi:hypothetical protein
VSVAAPPIVLLTDYGADDWYAGVLHGVLLARSPGAALVDLTHSVPPGDVAAGAFILENAWRWFAEGTVFLVVVDPGVGTERRPLAVRAAGRFFVGPDNGVLSPALSASDAEARQIEGSAVGAVALSPTFHGRDLFAPAAAALHRGTAFDSLGPVVSNPVIRGPEVLVVSQDLLVGRVVYVDRFGNCITDIPEGALERFLGGAGAPLVRLGTHAVRRWARTYGEAAEGEALALIGSSGRLEIAVRGGDAARRLGVVIGDVVEVRRARG